MARNKEVGIPIPINGLNTLNPFLPVEAGYARDLTNYALIDGRLRMRPSIENGVYSAGAGAAVFWYDLNLGTTWYGIDALGQIINLSAFAVVGNIGGAPGIVPTQVKHGTLDLVIGMRQPRLSAYPFTAWTFTTLTLTATSLAAACSHKARLYVSAGTAFEYSALNALTGTMEGYVDIAAYLDGQTIFRMFSVSVSPNITSSNVFVVFGNGGKVLIWQGLYPGSDDWSLIGTFNMTRPTSIAGFVEIDGDIFVSGANYCYWFRDLFTGGAQSAYENSPTRPIENLYQAVDFVDSVFSTGRPHSYYIDKIDGINIDAIVVQCSSKSSATASLQLIADYNNPSVCFVYFRKYKAWSLWFTSPFFAPVRQISSVYYGTSSLNGQLTKLTASKAVDVNGTTTSGFNIETSWKTPYMSPFSGLSQRVNGIRPFFANSVSGYMHQLELIADFSDFNAPWGFFTQETVATIAPENYSADSIDLPANSSAQYNAFGGPQVIGGGFSVQFTMRKKTGSSDTQTQSIYAATAYVEDGGELF